MGTLYLGTKAIYTDDQTGFYWDSPLKKERLNADGTPYTTPVVIAEVTTTISDPVETKTEIPEIKQEEYLKCEVCGFEAKSKAGLAVHKMHARHFSE